MITFIHTVANIAMIACLAIVMLKILWNLALPYGLATMKEKKAVSFFPLIEIVPWLVALGLAAANSRSWVSPKLIFVGVSLALLATYVHFCIVALIVGLRQRSREQ